MRFFRVLKAPPRFLILALLFGVMVALTVRAADPPPPGPVQNFQDYYCAPITCKDIGTVADRPGCAKDFGCKLAGGDSFGTCRSYAPQLSGFICTNSNDAYGHIECRGICQDDMNLTCGLYVYKCASTAPLPPPAP